MPWLEPKSPISKPPPANHEAPKWEERIANCVTGARKNWVKCGFWHFTVLQINLSLCISVGQEKPEQRLWCFITSFRDRWARGWADELREQPRAAPASPWAAPPPLPPPGHSSPAGPSQELQNPEQFQVKIPAQKAPELGVLKVGKTQDVQLKAQPAPAQAGLGAAVPTQGGASEHKVPKFSASQKPELSLRTLRSSRVGMWCEASSGVWISGRVWGSPSNTSRAALKAEFPLPWEMGAEILLWFLIKLSSTLCHLMHKSPHKPPWDCLHFIFS